MTKSLRPGKLFIDYFRNSLEQTSVAAYSTRARPGAPVSVPVRRVIGCCGAGVISSPAGKLAGRGERVGGRKPADDGRAGPRDTAAGATCERDTWERGRDSEEAIEKRYRGAKREIWMAKGSRAFDDMVINDDIDRAVDEIARLIRQKKSPVGI